MPILDRLRDFLFRLLHWFEAMSILKVHDACRFARLFAHPVEAHLQLVCLSALPFTPTNAVLYWTFHHPGSYHLILWSLQQSWSPLQLGLAGHEMPVT